MWARAATSGLFVDLLPLVTHLCCDVDFVFLSLRLFSFLLVRGLNDFAGCDLRNDVGLSRSLLHLLLFVFVIIVLLLSLILVAELLVKAFHVLYQYFRDLTVRLHAKLLLYYFDLSLKIFAVKPIFLVDDSRLRTELRRKRCVLDRAFLWVIRDMSNHLALVLQLLELVDNLLGLFH